MESYTQAPDCPAMHAARTPLLTAIAGSLLAPSLVLIVSALASGLPVGEVFSAWIRHVLGGRPSVLATTVLNLAPVGMLAIVLFAHARGNGSEITRGRMAWAGCIAILIITVWVNLQFWPRFFPAQQPLGFPHGIELVIGPLFFAPFAALSATAGTWILDRVLRK